MIRRIKRWVKHRWLIFLISLIISTIYAHPSQSHVADLSLLNMVIEPKIAQINLTLSTKLVAFADTDGNNQLSSQEIEQYQVELERFFSDRLLLTDSEGQKARVTVEAKENSILGSNLPSNNHSAVFLTYTWTKPVTQVQIDYNLFDKIYNTHCLATIFSNGELKNYTLMPKHKILRIDLTQGRGQLLNQSGLIAFMVAFSWGAIHALSPGHGKTLVGAYLVGSKAKAKHALFLGLTTTITHTLGVFGLGIVALVASQYLFPIQFYPWLSLGSGLMILIIGLNLLKNRLSFRVKTTEHHHHHEHHEHHHHHGLSEQDESAISWRRLMTLGVAGGLVPCPAALVLLLSTIALGQIEFGLLLVFIFSLGLTGTLTGIGLLLVSAKNLFERIPNGIINTKAFKFLPVVSAIFIAIVGLALTYQAMEQIYALTLPIPYGNKSLIL